MKVNSNNSEFSAKDFSFDVFLQQKKEAAARNGQSNGVSQGNPESISGTQENESSILKSDTVTLSKNENTSAGANEMNEAKSILQNEKYSSNVQSTAKNLIDTQMQKARENGSKSGVMGNNFTSRGSGMSEQMEARQAGKQAENLQVNRQNAVLAASMAEAATMDNKYLAGLRAEARMKFEKKQSVLEKAEENFKKMDENRAEEMEKMYEEQVNGGSDKGNSADGSTKTTDSSSDDPVVTTSSDSSAELTTSGGGGEHVTTTGGSGGDVTIPSGNTSSDASITTGSGSAEPVTTGGSSGGGSGKVNLDSIDVMV